MYTSLCDDIALVAENEDDLQQLIIRVANWCRKNHLTINLDKTNILHIHPKCKPRSSFPFTCNNAHITYSNEYKYLGVWFNEHLDISQTIEHISRSGRKALAGMCARPFETIWRFSLQVIYFTVQVQLPSSPNFRLWCMFMGISAILPINLGTKSCYAFLLGM